ncbi:MAG: OmpA family protein [Verrucomicrobiales bacterium]|nr:OmpA family protein [Verrucomicrobiales bacterium]
MKLPVFLISLFALVAFPASQGNAQVRFIGFESGGSSSEKKTKHPRYQVHPSAPALTPKAMPKYAPKPTPKPSNPINSKKMVSILQGKTSAASNSRPVVTARTTKIAPKVMPKGYETFRMKQGRGQAQGSSPDSKTGGGSKTLYMKDGRDRAEGSSGPVHTTRVKEGRPAAGGYDPAPKTKSYGGASLISSHDYGRINQAPSGGYPAAPPAELSYRVDSSSQLSTNSVRFRKGSTDLADETSYRYLLSLSAALQDSSLSDSRFVVEGHASADGSDYANLVLSQKRANAIYDFLISRGVSPQRLLAVGHGEHHALFSSYEPEYLLAQDRQVIVFRLAD